MLFCQRLVSHPSFPNHSSFLPPPPADTLPQRLVWGGVRVVVLSSACAQPTTCTDAGDGGTVPHLPADVTTVTCVDGDWGACIR